MAPPKPPPSPDPKAQQHALSVRFKAQQALTVGFLTLLLLLHALAIYLFCSGFLLSRLVLPDRSECGIPPIQPANGYVAGDAEQGCWFPKRFDKAVIVVVDALRYDFTVPFDDGEGGKTRGQYHDQLGVLWETSVAEPTRGFLRPFIADPPTTTLQRLKGLTTGSLPTLVEGGSNFAGTAIDEDNLIEQLNRAGKRIVHLGDDTWHALFPGSFDANLTRAYDSFNVWDLHTVDKGVTEHVFPLLEPGMRGQWDVIIGHYLGVDHAGHRYGPDHPAMGEKLREMDGVVVRMIEALDDETLLVVLGDHGMDVKGDHGGESEDEVQAALWMYSKKGIFGRGDGIGLEPPRSAKERPVAQIDLVPTLALLLGLPIPFNNLGQPIEEAFIGAKGVDYGSSAEVGRLTAAQIHRYQGQYSEARNLDDDAASTTRPLWEAAIQQSQQVEATKKPSQGALKSTYDAFAIYQAENVRVCRHLWARFDLVSMGMGITVLVGSVALLAAYARAITGDRAAITPVLLGGGLAGLALGAAAGAAIGYLPSASIVQSTSFGAGLGGVIGISVGFWPARQELRIPYPRTFWGGLSFLTCLLLCIGFASNSFTIWEDEQLLFFLTTFGFLMLGSSLGQPDPDDRMLGTWNSVSFLAATRLASFSRLCREEQMPNCRSTYYASASSSTSAAWQLAIPIAIAIFLPSIIKYFFHHTKNYQGSAVIWIGIALRIGLFLVAGFWILDAADDGNWYPDLSKSLLKTTRVIIAQAVLALAFAAGYATYVFASPFLAVINEPAPTEALSSTSKPVDVDGGPSILTTINAKPTARPKLIILGYANTQGSRYLLLPLTWLLALLLLQKPMGQGTLALCFISILNLLEIIDANNLRLSALGPVVLALMGSYYYFKTGHQATLSSIQWESAFIPLSTVSYPWTPVLVILNTFGAQIICAIAVPAIPLWKVKPTLPGLLGRVAGAVATHGLVYGAFAVATVIEAAWLRRHLMLYRIFMPRMLMSVAVLVVVEVVGVVGGMVGVRWSMGSVGEVFGWEE
nr:hypothetical protein B0A51_02402 [Rachicladosporium sp. CCFEE 5018]